MAFILIHPFILSPGTGYQGYAIFVADLGPISVEKADDKKKEDHRPSFTLIAAYVIF